MKAVFMYSTIAPRCEGKLQKTDDTIHDESPKYRKDAYMLHVQLEDPIFSAST